jgi:hypothetical protein
MLLNTLHSGILQFGKCRWYSATAAVVHLSQNPYAYNTMAYLAFENIEGIKNAWNINCML